jgi:hypothetical protein
MRTTRPSAFSALLVVSALAASLLACNKEEAKKAQDEPKKTTPVPSDMVFNDFLPAQGGAQGVAVRMDGGAEAGLAAASGDGGGGGGGATEPGAAAAPIDEAAKLKVTEPGAEPRVARKYTFTPNRVDKRLIVLRQSVSQGGRAQEQPPLALTVDLTPKVVKPTGTTFEMKIVNVDLADKDKIPPAMAAQLAQATQQLAAFNGMTATFDVDPHGSVGEVALQADAKLQKAGAEEMLGTFQQAVELMLPPLPDAPIGVGARWERSVDAKQMGLEIKGKHSFELKEVDKDGGTIAATIQQKVPKRAIPDPRARGATVEVDATGSYTYAFKFDRVSTKVQGELKRKESIEVPGEGGKKETVVRDARIVHLMTSR